jgi:hypothetical protein
LIHIVRLARRGLRLSDRQSEHALGGVVEQVVLRSRSPLAIRLQAFHMARYQIDSPSTGSLLSNMHQSACNPRGVVLRSARSRS